MHRAIGLISGLDSILALRLLSSQGVEVLPVHFTTPFIDTPKPLLALVPEVESIPLPPGYIEFIKSPRYGYGRNLNPCLDCRIFMLSQARSLMEERKADFVFTGEVLGQRPFTQHREALELTEVRSGLKGLLLRPLSAQLLPPTRPELEGLVDRSKLLALQGRGRKHQLQLAKKFGLEEIPSPAGGCRLTDPIFAHRLKDGLTHNEVDPRHLELLRYGRHFRLPQGSKVVVGRNELENKRLLELVGPQDVLIEVVDVGSPVVLLLGGDREVGLAARLCVRYSDARGRARVRIWRVQDLPRFIEADPLPESEVEGYRI